MTFTTSPARSHLGKLRLHRHLGFAALAMAVAIWIVPVRAAEPVAKQPAAKPIAAAKQAEPKRPIGTLPPLDKASWIWSPAEDDVCQLRTVFTLDDAPTAASILITADNGYELFINGAAVGYDIGAGGEVWSSVERYDITTRLARGRNVIGIRGTRPGRDPRAGGGRAGRGQGPAAAGDRHRRLVAGDGRGDPVDYSHPEFVEKVRRGARRRWWARWAWRPGASWPTPARRAAASRHVSDARWC